MVSKRLLHLVAPLVLCCVAALVRWYSTQAAVLAPPRKITRLQPSTTPTQVAAVLQRDGVVIIERLATEETIAASMAELRRDRAKDGNIRFGENSALWRRPLDAETEAATKKLADEPLVLEAAELVRQVHGPGSDHCISWELRLLVISPGYEAGPLHRDVVDTSKVPLERPMQWGLNAIWAVDNYTAENGATRFIVGSHHGAEPQGHWDADHPDVENLTEAAVMPAGSVVLYYASLLHASGASNATALRTGMNFNYCAVDAAGGRPAGWGW